MCDDDDRLSIALIALLQKMDDLLTGIGVEIACRLIGKHESGRVYQGAADGDALLLSSGKLIGQMMQAICDPQLRHQIGKLSFIHSLFVKQKRQFDILLYI